ncbi:hypothetical protein mRhiFer1_009178 [Rhinolophus ferrumequinum]|uniref:Uncharacterized protein n=1 Tax=Rhinolophus ferrumequinum TaxID=59479 RepID=A0A7J7SJ26_RHIFE|nr:hypothetical protein mRhiFer1_009178 [Rhinolophus ferrumequinum]
MGDDNDWARKMTAANALASPTFHLWQTASSTASCAVFGSWAFPELQGDTAVVIVAIQQNRETVSRQTLEDDIEFIHLLKQEMPSKSLGSTYATPGYPTSEPCLSHLPSLFPIDGLAPAPSESFT